MPRGAQALLELPSETVAILRAARPSVVAPSVVGACGGACMLVLGGVVLAVTVGLDGMAWRHLALSAAFAHPIAWSALSVIAAGAWAFAQAWPLAGLNEPSLQAIREKLRSPNATLNGLIMIYIPIAAVCLLPVPDIFPTRSLEDPPELAATFQLASLAVGLGVLSFAAGMFTLAPVLYVRDPKLGVRAAMSRSRELARGRRLLFLTVAVAPAALAAAGVATLLLGDEVTLGRQLLGAALARPLASFFGITCLGLAPTLAAALKSAALNLATRAD